MYSQEFTAVQVYRNHARLSRLIGETGEILTFTQIKNRHFGIVRLSDKTNLPIEIDSIERPKIGQKVKIVPKLIGKNKQNLRQYGVIGVLSEL